METTSTAERETGMNTATADEPSTERLALATVGMNMWLGRNVTLGGVDVKTVANEAGIHESTWRELEAARVVTREATSYPRLDLLVRISGVLDLRPSQILEPIWTQLLTVENGRTSYE